MSPIDTTKDLDALFSAQVQQTPEQLALEDEHTQYTYAQLDAKVDTVARVLRARGVKRDSLVGVLLPRSSDYVIACLATLRAGGAFLVLELAYPPDLLTDVIADAQPIAVVTYRSEATKIKQTVPLVLLDESIDLPSDVSNQRGVTNGAQTSSESDLERLAFVAYSSGTTGHPKGIANPHRAPVLSYNLRFRLSNLEVGDRVACNVFFVWEILRPLIRGATVVAVTDEISYDPAALVDLLATKKITETLMTPTLLAAVLSRYSDLGNVLPTLRTLWLNGEVVTTNLAQRALKALPRVRLLNCYSACETHEVACGDVAKDLDRDATYCPVGMPLEPQNIYILNESGHRAEVGTSGELYVGGSLLARGYLNRPEITANSFLPDPYDSTPGARMYKTGDLARMLPSGLLEITGRVGAMIKLRGYSVVPGKVESAIVTNLAVRQCAVIAHGEGLDRQLVAYIVPDQENAEHRPEVQINSSGHSPSARKALGPYLAQYMIPALWVALDKMPTHEVSGKADLKSLPLPPTMTEGLQRDTPREADLVDIESIAQLWAATLKVSRSSIDPEHSFFDLGGHSLSIADLASRLSKTFGLKIPVARLADPATLNGHLHSIRAIRDGEIAAVQTDLPSILRADSVLDSDIQPRGATIRPLKKAEVILLTGATGFLGAFLLNDLLETTTALIICLVRFTEPSEQDIPAGIARIRKNLIELGLWRDSIMERIEILPGTLSRKRLGLSPTEFAKLAARTQIIFHAAATVNLVYPYATLRAANIGGTREILRLASLTGATVHFVSTNGVLPPSNSRNGYGWPEDTSLYVDMVPEKLLDGYGQTKWVAEQLIHEAGRRGLPVKIIRAGTISGHSASGAANPWDLLNAIFVESLRIGYAPDVQGWRAEMTPVDFVSKAIVHLADQIHAKQLVFHVGDPEPVNTSKVFDDFKALGYPTKPVSWNKWVTLWTEQRGSVRGGDGSFTIDILRSGMPSIEFLQDIVVLDNAQTRPYRAHVERPKVDIVLLETYARHWFARGWLPRPPVSQFALGGAAHSVRKSVLTGRVAVITGASSGIGAAVAVALAREGCHIVLAARRLDALESVKKRMVTRDCKVIAKATDVTDKKQVEELMKLAERELGPVDILVSCAGVMYFTMMANAHVDDWERTVDVNCKGLLYCLSAAVPRMLSRGSGHIVAISSDAGRKVFPGLGVYSASKFFVEATLQSVRLETAGKGLRVTSVQPGNVATDLLSMSTDKEALEKYGEPSGAVVLEPEDVAASIIYALKQPEHVAINEVLIEPRDEPI